jgi:EAL and modified HD-GYP domain-containing signal transduction protein
LDSRTSAPAVDARPARGEAPHDVASRPAEQVLFGRQPIVDRDGRMQAFELLFRSGRVNAARPADDLVATSQVLHHVFAELGVDRALGPYRGFVNCDERILLMPDTLDVLPSERIVIEILESVRPDGAIIERLRELKRAGYLLALDDYDGESAQPAAFLGLMDFVKIDLARVAPSALSATVEPLRGLRARLVAEKVQTREQAAQCRAVGIDLFQGYYFARPVLVEGRKLGMPQLALLRLLHLLAADADNGAIVDEFKHHPGLSLNMLRIANSAALQRVSPVASISQALVVVGRRNLRRWVQLLLYADGATGTVANPLLQLAATRGRLMESLAQSLAPDDGERAELAFMVGILSLMPVVFGVPFTDILPALPLPAEAQDALLRRAGPIGALLQAIESQESDDHGGRLPGGVDDGTYSRHLAEAMAWANRIG